VAADRAEIFPGEPTQPHFRMRVLIVEDNAVNQMVAARLLEKLGCRVDLAANGREAVEMIGLLPYDAIFMAKCRKWMALKPRRRFAGARAEAFTVPSSP
jgi:two-component system, sensor histidine kinase and response regulator